MNDMEIIKSYSIEQIENEQHLIINAYYMNQKVATTDAGSIDNIMGKVKLFSEEYETLQQENQLMFKIQDNYNQLQSNWNNLRELIEQYLENEKYNYMSDNPKDRCRYDIFMEIKDRMNELEGKDKE